ncbi:hypothetical protein KAH27_09360 [bacterium]|nr:hypothetical protein [bacterium]
MNVELMNKRIWVKGILVECPLGKSLNDCLANALRNLPLEELIKAVNNMTEDQLEMVIKYHNSCLAKRLKANDKINL